jgi:hypothetical protein
MMRNISSKTSIVIFENYSTGEGGGLLEAWGGRGARKL